MFSCKIPNTQISEEVVQEVVSPGPKWAAPKVFGFRVVIWHR